MRLEHVQNLPKNDQNRPKNVENQQNWPKIIQKMRNLQQNSYSGQKPRDFPLKSYCWSPNLLGSSFPASDTICTSGSWEDQNKKCVQVYHKKCKCKFLYMLCSVASSCSSQLISNQLDWKTCHLLWVSIVEPVLAGMFASLGHTLPHTWPAQKFLSPWITGHHDSCHMVLILWVKSMCQRSWYDFLISHQFIVESADSL